MKKNDHLYARENGMELLSVDEAEFARHPNAGAAEPFLPHRVLEAHVQADEQVCITDPKAAVRRKPTGGGTQAVRAACSGALLPSQGNDRVSVGRRDRVADMVWRHSLREARSFFCRR